LWAPGYWAYDSSISDYYWVDGEWILAPEEGLLWTPGYWSWRDGGFFFNDGYWGPEVGFYGGINYGFGYFGEGYGGGRWDHGHFFYNRSVNHIDLTINHNVYNTVIENHNDNRVSFNGGSGGIVVRATMQQEAVARQRHIPPVVAQTEHMQTARANPELRASANHSNPPPRENSVVPLGFNDHSSTPTHPDNTATHAVIHPNDLPPIARPVPSNSGNAKADQKYQQQQEKLVAQQTQDRQVLQQKQEAEHQPNESPVQTQKLEQKHSQETQQLSQRHATQQQTLQSRQPQPRPRK
jgi:hypothetical protein